MKKTIHSNHNRYLCALLLAIFAAMMMASCAFAAEEMIPVSGCVNGQLSSRVRIWRFKTGGGSGADDAFSSVNGYGKTLYVKDTVFGGKEDNYVALHTADGTMIGFANAKYLVPNYQAKGAGSAAKSQREFSYAEGGYWQAIGILSNEELPGSYGFDSSGIAPIPNGMDPNVTYVPSWE